MLKRSEIPSYKESLFKEQQGLCALTGLPIDEISKAHLDHDHRLDGPSAGRCRGLLLGNANVLEGRLKHQFNRSGLAGQIDYIDFLKRLVSYLERDNTDRPRHPQMIPDLKKRFSRYNLSDMRQNLSEVHLETQGTKKELQQRYAKYLKVQYGKDKEIRQ
ncbi:TPA: endonuclease domain-containing protein [Enterobacter hormaechei]|nr:hypothetical protein [Enterobacter hormaechei]EKT9367248.1 hypothetical protein [Enterobacter hormaechei]EKW5510070.1 hypothetical protein [Enterobacter hormaechei]EMA4428626.1 hypothetical protein [Enterobacter hormaechei]EMD5672611.1 hypothetical protein [Enterobacter hormaechei]